MFHGDLDGFLDPQTALLRSQGGLVASAPFISMPYHDVSRMESQVFRLLFLRRLRLPLPPRPCGRLLDSLGHHRSTLIKETEDIEFLHLFVGARKADGTDNGAPEWLTNTLVFDRTARAAVHTS